MPVMINREARTVAGQIQILWTPGHSDGHICVFEEKEGVFLAGNHLLYEITQISVTGPWPMKTHLTTTFNPWIFLKNSQSGWFYRNTARYSKTSRNKCLSVTTIMPDMANTLCLSSFSRLASSKEKVTIAITTAFYLCLCLS